MNALITLLAMLAGHAQAGFSLQLVQDDPVRAARWPTALVTYWLEYAGSDDLAPEVAVGAVRRALATWTRVACADLAFQELGDVPDPLSTMLTGAPQDGKNEIVWIEDASWHFGQYVLGVTAPIIGAGGVIVEADIAFNGKDVLWTVNGNGGMDLEGVALHELGHFVGIQHNPGPYLAAQPPTMAPYATADARGRTLEDDDRAALCYLYPWTSWTCASNAECPLFMNQRLEADERIVGYQPCNTATGHCEGIVRFVQRLVGFGERCLTIDACYEGLVCHPFADAVGAAPGEVISVCTTPCRPLGDGASLECPGGYTCATQAPPLDDAGMCVPVDGVVYAPGAGPSGCFEDAECGPGRGCVASPTEPGLKRCAARCVLGEAGCPGGMSCVDVGEGLGGCFTTAIAEGDAEADGADEATSAEAGPEADADADAASADGTAEGGSAEADATGETRCAGGAAGAEWLAAAGLALALRRRRSIRDTRRVV